MNVSVCGGDDRDQLADERPHHPGLLGHADADHRHEHDGDDAEAGEVVDERREDEPDARRRRAGCAIDVVS